MTEYTVQIKSQGEKYQSTTFADSPEEAFKDVAKKYNIIRRLSSLTLKEEKLEGCRVPFYHWFTKSETWPVVSVWQIS